MLAVSMSRPVASDETAERAAHYFQEGAGSPHEVISGHPLPEYWNYEGHKAETVHLK